jgi:hypothetical protein
MKSLSGRHPPVSTQLLLRMLERSGPEDAAEIVALASTDQLQRAFDDDLWQADRAGGDETFRPERFALWLRAMQEAGEDVLVQRLCELPLDLVALGVHRLVLVLDMDVAEEQLSWAGEEGEPIARALEAATFEEWEELRLIARDPDAWDDVWSALIALDREHHDQVRAILEKCCAMSTEYISGQGGLYQVLTAEEMLEGDVAAARDDRRVAEGFVSPADARAFLALARRGEADPERDPITRAYFRELRGGNTLAALPAPRVTPLALPPGEPAPAAGGDALPARAHVAAPLFEQAMSDLRQRDPERFAARVLELGYLVNVWIAGGAHDRQRPRPAEAVELVLKTCEAGIRKQLARDAVTREQALAVLVDTPADALFRRGFHA